MKKNGLRKTIKPNKFNWSESKIYFFLGIPIAIIIGLAIGYYFFRKSPSKHDVENIRAEVNKLDTYQQDKMNQFQIDRVGFLNNHFIYGYEIYFIDENNNYEKFQNPFNVDFSIELGGLEVVEGNKAILAINKINDARSKIYSTGNRFGISLPTGNKILNQNDLFSGSYWGLGVMVQNIGETNYIFVVGLHKRTNY